MYRLTNRSEEDAMHPLFVELFIKTDAEDLLAEEERRRTRRARHDRKRMVMTVPTRR